MGSSDTCQLQRDMFPLTANRALLRFGDKKQAPRPCVRACVRACVRPLGLSFLSFPSSLWPFSLADCGPVLLLALVQFLLLLLSAAAAIAIFLLQSVFSRARNTWASFLVVDFCSVEEAGKGTHATGASSWGFGRSKERDRDKHTYTKWVGVSGSFLACVSKGGRK